MADVLRNNFGGVPALRGTVITEVPGRPELAERSLFEVAAELGVTPVDVLFDLGLATDLEARFRMPVANHEESEVEPLLKSPATVLGLSDVDALTISMAQRVTADTPALVGATALARFETASDLQAYMRDKMPWHKPGSLQDGEYWELTAFLLSKNGISPLPPELDAQQGAEILLHQGQ